MKGTQDCKKYGVIQKKLEIESISSEDSLALINQYTRRDLSADEIYIFPISLCNNDIDRDYEKFTLESLNTLAPLMVGKTIVLDHHWSAKNQSARIFKTRVEKVEGKKTKDGEDFYHLTALAYTIKSDASKDFVLNIDAGILKEVSVGVGVQKHTCSICGEEYYGEQCQHYKGDIYDGQEMFVKLENINDAYEVSFVAVPAQAEAGVTKQRKGENKVEYNDKLKQYGIDEPTFQSIISKSKEINADLFLKILGAADIKNEKTFLSEEEVKKEIGEISKDDLLQKMKSYESLKIKVSEYDKIIQSATEKALKNGVKAKGENFDSERWTKIFKGFTYDEINAQSEEWKSEAEKELNVGGRVSQPQSEEKTYHINPEDYMY